MENKIELQEMPNKSLTREEAESINPSKGMAANDGVVISARIEHVKDIQSASVVNSEIQRTQSDIAKVREMYKGVDLSQAINDLAQDTHSLQVLSKKNVYQSLMQGEVVQAKHVSIDNSGKPRHYFGVKLYQLDRQINSNSPVLKLGFSTFDSLKLPEKIKGKTHSLVIDPQFEFKITNLLKGIGKALDSETVGLVNEFKHTLSTTNLTPSLQAHRLNQQLHNVANYYMPDDSNGKRKFLEESGKLIMLEQRQKISLRDKVSSSEPGSIYNRIHVIPVTQLPLKYNGVQLTEKQIQNLLIGNTIELAGLTDPKLPKSYSASVNYNILTGKVVEPFKNQLVELSLDKNIASGKSLLNGDFSSNIKSTELVNKNIDSNEKPVFKNKF